jgi:hypothetical protein
MGFDGPSQVLREVGAGKVLKLENGASKAKRVLAGKSSIFRISVGGRLVRARQKKRRFLLNIKS